MRGMKEGHPLVRTSITIDFDTWSKIRDYRFENQIDSFSGALRVLVNHALDEDSENPCTCSAD